MRAEPCGVTGFQGQLDLLSKLNRHGRACAAWLGVRAFCVFVMWAGCVCACLKAPPTVHELPGASDHLFSGSTCVRLHPAVGRAQKRDWALWACCQSQLQLVGQRWLCLGTCWSSTVSAGRTRAWGLAAFPRKGKGHCSRRAQLTETRQGGLLPA